MSHESFTLEAMLANPAIRAQRAAAEAVFSWRRRSVDVPEGWLALVTSKHRDAVVVTGGGRVINDEVEHVLWVRDTPIECRVEDDHLRTRDGYIGRGVLCCRVRIIPEAAELAAFARTFCITDATVSDDVLCDHLAAPLHSIMARLVAEHDAAALLTGLDARDVRPHVEQGSSSACLVAGLTLDGPVTLDFDSGDYHRAHQQAQRVAREKERQDARREIQHALARAQEERLDDVVSLLEKMQSAAGRHEHVDLAALMKTFDPTERGELYAALWHLEGTSARTESVAVVAGQALLLLPVNDPEHPAPRFTLPDDLGLLRSVQRDNTREDERLLLIGAATGAWVLDVDTGQVRHRLVLDLPEERQVRGGFNAVARHGPQILGSHSELGLVRWQLHEQDTCVGETVLETLTARADAIRGVQAADGVLWFIVDDAVYAWHTDKDPQAVPTRYGGSNTLLTSLRVHDDRVYAGNVDGEILAWTVGDPESAQVVRGVSDGMVESIHVRTIGAITQLVFADRRRGLATIIVEDGYELRHTARDQIVRRAVAAPDVMAAMNDARDRLIIWPPDHPREPSLSANIDQLTGHRIQDLCLVPMKV